ncbi:hypothetical protein AVME950_00505 [Acidovorax sp. SUPP950]|uniref:hypothetical protein n=1 Tax=Acidovorax sp. SUPP950 TaxID=511901 RepID=UPI0023C05EF3|nr:hypothetical protein [Acidovorax sp. SUPP950]GKS73319.1 hypothetical protein AVME950_00505 [Acidovorax sp. SUPP950]
MQASEFVSNWYQLKGELVAAFTTADGTSETAKKITALNLTPTQFKQVECIIDNVIRDTMYTLLLGLDGAASIGNDQRHLTIADESGQPIGNLEDEAWRRFHGNQ